MKKLLFIFITAFTLNSGLSFPAGSGQGSPSQNAFKTLKKHFWPHFQDCYKAGKATFDSIYSRNLKKETAPTIALTAVGLFAGSSAILGLKEALFPSEENESQSYFDRFKEGFSQPWHALIKSENPFEAYTKLYEKIKEGENAGKTISVGLQIKLLKLQIKAEISRLETEKSNPAAIAAIEKKIESLFEKLVELKKEDDYDSKFKNQLDFLISEKTPKNSLKNLKIEIEIKKLKLELFYSVSSYKSSQFIQKLETELKDQMDKLEAAVKADPSKIEPIKKHLKDFEENLKKAGEKKKSSSPSTP